MLFDKCHLNPYVTTYSVIAYFIPTMQRKRARTLQVPRLYDRLQDAETAAKRLNNSGYDFCEITLYPSSVVIEKVFEKAVDNE